VATYEDIAREYGGPLERLVRGYEANEDKQRDLLQEIHVGIWRGLRTFDGRASIRTWVYRVAHNVAVSHVMRSSRSHLERCLPLDEALETVSARGDLARESEARRDVARLAELVRTLRPIDRQVILLYLEGFEHAEISEVCGLSSENAATKVHRIKHALAAALGRKS
jgi:RNA polymerase sigma-70 factor (ECF subfamily)